jgi:hypothetical protein
VRFLPLFGFATDDVHETDKKEGGVAQIYQKYCWGVSILDGVEKEEEGGESN